MNSDSLVRCCRLFLLTCSVAGFTGSHVVDAQTDVDGRRPPAQEDTLTDTPDLGNGSLASAVTDVKPGTELTEAGFKQTLRETGGKYIVIQVYMEACGPCMTEALRLTQQREPWRKLGVAILGMGMDETPDGPQAFYRHTGKRITYPLYLAPWFSSQQKVDTTPTLFIYDADGEQLFRTDVEIAEDDVMTALTTKLAQLLKDE